MNSDHVQTIREVLREYRTLAIDDDREEIVAQLDAALTALEEAAGWEMVEEYSEIYATGEDGKQYTIGVDGDSNTYVARQDPRGVILALPPANHRLFRKRQPAQGGDA